MPPWQKRLLVGAIALVVLGLLAWPKVQPLLADDGSNAGAGPPRSGGAPANVVGYVAEPRLMRDRIRATGSLIADEAVDLAAEVSGRVTAIRFQEGRAVRAGQVLIQVNDAVLQAEREQLRTRIDLAETREARQRQLLESGAVSQDTYDGALAELNVLRAELDLVEARLDQTQVRAPFSGVIGLRYISEGAIVTPQTRIATLQRLSPMKLEFALPERYTTQVTLGDAVRFTVAGAAETATGTVYAIEPRVERDTRTLLVRARVPNPDGALLPGAFADIEVLVDEIADALPVPAIAVVSELGGRRVWTVQDGQAQQRRVETGIRTENAVQITDGLAPGDTVITSGLQSLRAGQPVRVADLDASLGESGEVE
ncbi:MAG: efflux RND transporter periplasmic adaptor subunit [Bacteroidota bacterium]